MDKDVALLMFPLLPPFSGFSTFVTASVICQFVHPESEFWSENQNISSRMFGEKAFELIKELQRSKSGTIPAFNVNIQLVMHIKCRIPNINIMGRGEISFFMIRGGDK